MFKKLYSSEILSTQNGFESFYKLEDILDFVTSPIYLESIESSTYKKKVPGLHKHYVDLSLIHI